MWSWSLTVAVQLLLAAATVSGQEAVSRSGRMVRTAPPPSFSSSATLPPPPGQDSAPAAVFRLKQTRPCECLNGGACHSRLRLCQCPLGYSGARCEHADLPLLSGWAATEADRIADPAPSVQMDTQRVQLAPARQLDIAEWLFYVPLFASVLLLCTLLRVAAILLKSYLSRGEMEKEEGEKARHPLSFTVVARQLPEESTIYTVPLPVRPPPYTEMLAGASPFAHSTPFKSKLPQPLQHVLPSLNASDYEAVNHLDDYAMIV